MSVARAGGRADTGADTAGVHASNGWEVGVVEDGELEGQPALDAAGKTRRVSEDWLLSRRLLAPVLHTQGPLRFPGLRVTWLSVPAPCPAQSPPPAARSSLPLAGAVPSSQCFPAGSSLAFQVLW